MQSTFFKKVNGRTRSRVGGIGDQPVELGWFSPVGEGGWVLAGGWEVEGVGGSIPFLWSGPAVVPPPALFLSSHLHLFLLSLLRRPTSYASEEIVDEDDRFYWQCCKC